MSFLPTFQFLNISHIFFYNCCSFFFSVYGLIMREFTKELIGTCIFLHSAPSWEAWNLPSSRGFFNAAVPDPTTPRWLVTLSQQHLSGNSDISNMEETSALGWIYFLFSDAYCRSSVISMVTPKRRMCSFMVAAWRKLCGKQAALWVALPSWRMSATG